MGSKPKRGLTSPKLQRLPLTPKTPSTSDGRSALATASPLTQRVFWTPTPAKLRQSPLSTGSTSGDLDEASRELRELWGNNTDVRDPWLMLCNPKSNENLPPSASSTTPIHSPSPDHWASGQSWPFYDTPGRSSPAEGDARHGPASAGRPSDAQGAGGRNLSQLRQGRKVFVGGIPQEMNQDDLYAIFSEFAVVERAWLQRRGSDQDHFMNNHRGFGFVVFYNETAVDELLGTSFSKFITLKDKRVLEVKRAVVSSMTAGSWSTPAGSPQNSRQHQVQPGASWPKDQSQSPQASWIGGPPGTWQPQAGPPPLVPPPPAPQADGAGSAPCAEAQQAALPAFPSVAGMQLSGVGVGRLCTPPLPIAVSIPTCETHPFVNMLASRPMMVAVADQPQTAVANRELEAALLQAMPDHYDD